ncbi:hypothetical protein EP331_07930 [bacterium]|nr:MAG: hypothetical protein EP331_07930 [bacterium]
MSKVATGWAWWDAQKPWVQNAVCLLFLFVLPLFLTPDTIFGDKQFLANDIVQWRGGSESIIQAREKFGEEPLWAANMYGGMPAYFISYNLEVKNIDTLVSKLFHGIFPAAIFWVGLSGLFFLFRYVRASHIASLFGAVTTAFTTYVPIIIGAGHNTKFLAFNYIPWLFLGFFMILSGDKRKLLSLAIFSLAFSLELRAGHPQVTYYFGIVMAIVWAYKMIQWLKGKDWSSILKTNIPFLIGVVLALLSVVQPYWSKTEFTPFSTRGGSVTNTSSGLDFDYAMAWSQGWGELLTLAVPNSYGGASGDGAYWGPKAFTSGPHYLGAIAILFVLISLVYVKHWLKTPLLIAGILSMLFSLGNNFAWFNELFFNYMPYFSKFRTPEMWLIATVFSFAILAVLGFDSVWENLQADKKWLYITGAVVGFGFIIAVAGSSVLSFEKAGEKRQIAEQIARSNRVAVSDPRVQQSANQYVQNQLKPEREKAASSDAWRLVILVGLSGGVLYLVSIKKIHAAYAGIALVLLASFDMLSVGKRYIPEYSKVKAGMDQVLKVKQQLSSLDEFIKNNQFDEAKVWPYRAYPIASNPFNNAAPSFYYPSIGGYTAVKIGAFQDLINEALNDKDGLPRNQILSMLNVKYMPVPQNVQLPGFKTAYSDESGVVLELESVLPKAWFVDAVTPVKTSKEALGFIKKDDFSPKESAVVEGLEKSYSVNPGIQREVEITRYEPRLIEIKTKHLEDAFLVLSEVYYPKGWKAELDGNEIPIYKTDFVLRGVEVPKGDHTITFSFNPQSYELGKTISWAGTISIWALVLAGIFVSFKKEESAE